MGLIVQKYGGTSVGSTERIQAVAQRIQKTVQAGHSVVVVVSAMGKTTDALVKLAQEVSSRPCRREMDMLLSTGEQVTIAILSMALQEIGQPAISLTGAQVGIVTEADHSRARILHVSPDRLQRHLTEGKVVVVAGFQGISNTEDLEVTTLGRGGSDTSAVALAAALGADFCEIYTDVPGVLSTDPRLVPNASLMAEITSDEMLELASLGAGVLHPRAVEIARNYGVEMVVRSSWTDAPGTRILSPQQPTRPLVDLELGRPVDGVQFDLDQAKVALLRVADRPGIASHLFGELASQAVDVDLIIQSIHDGDTNDIAFTVSRPAVTQAEAVSSALSSMVFQPQERTEPNQTEVVIARDIAKVGIVGAGMIGRPAIPAQMFATLADAGINLQMISTSEAHVSCTIDSQDCDRAIQLLCETFDVESSPAQPNPSALDENAPAVRGVALDLKQAQMAIYQVPDQPGMASKFVQALADHNIGLDMIIQSQRSRPVNGQKTRDIAFTVPAMDLPQAQEIIETLAQELGCGEVTADSDVAKVSIVGIGMLGRPGVAADMFKALAAQNINIQMIATSEIRVSCVVAESDGIPALRTIHAAFGLEQDAVLEVPA